MNLEEMSDILKSSLGIRDNIVGVRLFKSEGEIPKDLDPIEKPFHYCSMIQTARLKGESFLARADYHQCKGGASGIGIIECPENISTGSLYFDKLHKCETKDVGATIVASMPRLDPGSIVASYVAPLDKMVMSPDVVIFVGNPLQARRIVQAVMFKKGGSKLQHSRHSVLLRGRHGIALLERGSEYIPGLRRLGAQFRPGRRQRCGRHSFRDDGRYLLCPENPLPGLG